MSLNTETQILTKELLEDYGFEINEKKTKERLTVMTKDLFEIVIVDDGSVFYSNLYPLKDVAALKKLYKEVRREELKK